MIKAESVWLDFGTLLAVEAVVVVVVVAGAASVVVWATVVVVVVALGAEVVVVGLFLSLSSPDGVDVGVIALEGSSEGVVG